MAVVNSGVDDIEVENKSQPIDVVEDIGEVAPAISYHRDDLEEDEVEDRDDDKPAKHELSRKIPLRATVDSFYGPCRHVNDRAEEVNDVGHETCEEDALVVVVPEMLDERND